MIVWAVFTLGFFFGAFGAVYMLESKENAKEDKVDSYGITSNMGNWEIHKRLIAPTSKA